MRLVFTRRRRVTQVGRKVHILSLTPYTLSCKVLDVARKREKYQVWDAEKVKALRKHLGLTQQQLAQELGTRQQTISEWETGMYTPRGTSRTLLNIIAERAGFHYQPGPESGGEDASPGQG